LFADNRFALDAGCPQDGTLRAERVERRLAAILAAEIALRRAGLPE
jgi:hypothetical protein